MKKRNKILSIIFLVAILLILFSLMIGQMNEYNRRNSGYESRDLRIVFNLGVTINEAGNLLNTYNVTVDKIREEPTWFEEGTQNVVVAYVVVNENNDVNEISNRINDEEIVWMCTIEYPDG